MTDRGSGRTASSAASLSATAVRLMGHSALNGLHQGLSLFLGLLLVPLLLRGLGAQGYGTWIAALILYGLLSAFDGGISAALVRAVSAGETTSGETAVLSSAVARAYFVIGCVGLVALAMLGPCAVAPWNCGSHHAMFLLLGLAFLFEQLQRQPTAVLQGRRAFVALNAILCALAVARFATVALATLRGELEFVAGAFAAVSFIGFLALRHAAAALCPAPTTAPPILTWKVLRPRVSFAIDSLSLSIAGPLIWQVPQLLVSTIAGPAALTAFHIAQKVPIGLRAVVDRASEVSFPAASAAEDLTGVRDIVFYTSQIVLALAAGPSAWLVVAAPVLLRTWVGDVDPSVVTILRLSVATIGVDLLAAGCFHALWGRGKARPLMIAYGGGAVLLLLLCSAGAVLRGATGVALGQLIACAVMTTTIVLKACSEFQQSSYTLLWTSIRRVVLPAVFTAALALFIQRLWSSDSWSFVLSSFAASMAVYFLGIAAFATQAERAAVRAVLVRTRSAG